MRLTIMSFLIILLITNSQSSFAKDDVKLYGSLQKDKERLDEFKDKIQDQKKEIKKIKKEEETIFGKMRYIQSLIDKKREEMSGLNDKKEVLNGQIEELNKQVSRLQERIDIQKEHLQNRSVVLYKISDMQYLKIIFSSNSYIDTLKRYKYLKLILNQDSELIDEYDYSKKEIEDKTVEIKKEKEKLDEIIKKVKNKEEEILAEKNSKEILLRKVRRKKKYFLKALKEFDEAAQKLERLVLKHQKSNTKSKISYKERFEDFKGILEFPVYGKIISFFGKEMISRKFNSYLFNNGIRIKASAGQDVKAVFSGEVIYSDWFRGYGKVIIITHGDGYYTIYSHLSELLKNVGDYIKRSDIIAKSGDTGSLYGPCLYFEIRHKGRSINPVDWFEPDLYSELNAVSKTKQ